MLNVIDFQNRQYTTTEAEFVENIHAREEFKLLDLDDDDDEREDLLGADNDMMKLKAAFAKRKFHTLTLLNCLIDLTVMYPFVNRLAI